MSLRGGAGLQVDRCSIAGFVMAAVCGSSWIERWERVAEGSVWVLLKIYSMVAFVS